MKGVYTFNSVIFFLGRVHPLIIHFPIAFITLLFIVECWQFFKKKVIASNLERNLLILCALTSIVSTILGLILFNQGHYLEKYATWHMWLGLATTLFTFVSCILYLKKNITYKLFIFLSFLFVVICGHFGVILERGENYLSIPFISKNKVKDITDGLLNHQQYKYYKNEIDPILQRRCVACHNNKNHILSFESVFDIVKLHNQKNIIIPFNKNKSLMFKTLNLPVSDKKHMPANRGKISQEEIKKIGQWIDKGAFSDEILGLVYTNEAQKHWAYRPFSKPKLPQVKNKSWALNEIDLFILSKLEKENLDAVKDASEEKILRRLSYDLKGLPPLINEINNFNKSDIKKKVTQYLKTNQYAERWTQYWLDLVSYADSSGYDIDIDRNWTKSYRNQIINELSHNRPWNELLLMQIAGDVLNPDSLNDKILSSYLYLGPARDVEPTEKHIQYQIWDNELNRVTQLYLGVDYRCARCHDHKLEPISQKNYYELLMAMQSTNPDIVDPLHVKEKFLNLTFEYEKRKKDKKYILKKYDIVKNKNFVFPKTRNDNYNGNVLVGGDPMHLGSIVNFSLPKLFSDTRTSIQFWQKKFEHYFLIKYPKKKLPKNGRWRSILALWLTDVKDGAGKYVARVMVDHVWRFYFGQGLVPTSGNFGMSGKAPLHIDLLNWLAFDFIEHGWSLNHLHHLITESHVYRLSTDSNQSISDIDYNLYRIRNVKPLDPEAWRDSVLYVCGLLDLSKYQGPPIQYSVDENLLVDMDKYNWTSLPIENKSNLRRSIYTFRKRGFEYPMYNAIGNSNYNEVTPKRPHRTGPLSALFFLNSDFLSYYSKLFSSKILKDKDHAAQTIYEKIYGRSPTSQEANLVTSILNKNSKNSMQLFVKAAFSSDEFVYLD